MAGATIGLQSEQFVHMHDRSRIFGVLHSWHLEEGSLIACIGVKRVVLPADMDLDPWLGKNIGIADFDGHYYIREADPE